MDKISGINVKKILHSNTGIGIMVIVAMLVLGECMNHSFLSSASIANILTGASILAIASIGQLLCVISGGVDLSIAGCISLGAVVSALMMNGDNQNLGMAVLILVISGIAIGCVNALGIIYANIPPLVMTLSVSNVVIVIQLIACNGSPTGSPAPVIRAVGKGNLLPMISYITLLLIVIAIMIGLLSKHNGYIKQLFVVGNNKNAAILAGVNVNAVLFVTYIISAML